MKKLIVAVTILSASLWAQSTPASPGRAAATKSNPPTYSQRYCAGFITRDKISRSNFVLGSKESPHEDRFQGRSELLLGGPGIVAGQRYTLLRQVSDVNLEDSSPDQRRRLAKLGNLYQDIGWVTVSSVGKDAAVARSDFSCEPAIPGDIVVPYVEKPLIPVREVDPPMDSFQETPNAVRGQILGGKDFDSIMGDGNIIYTDFGAAKGAKPGDYLLIIRGYASGDLNKIDRISDSLPKGAEPTTVNPGPTNAQGHSPVRILGEALVLSTTSQSSVALITRGFSEMELGDEVENETQTSSQPTAAQAAPAEKQPCQPSSRLHRLTHLQLHACK